MTALTSAANAFRRSRLLPSAHLETIATLFNPLPQASYTREIIDTRDRDEIALDYLSGAHDKPMLIMFHGLEGCSQSYTLRSLAQKFNRQGWTVAVPHFRGCGGHDNHLPRAYHAGDAEDVKWMIAYCRAYFNHSTVFYIGVSLGGSALIHHLVSAPEPRPAVTISTPFDLLSCVQKIDQGLNRRLYARHFLKSLRPKIIKKSSRYPSICNLKALKAARTIREFDELYTAPVHGYKSAIDYWKTASTNQWLSKISSPLLCINALNDPLIPADTLPAKPPQNDFVFFCHPKQGGHSAFIGTPPNWLFDTVNNFFMTHNTT